MKFRLQLQLMFRLDLPFLNYTVCSDGNLGEIYDGQLSRSFWDGHKDTDLEVGEGSGSEPGSKSGPGSVYGYDQSEVQIQDQVEVEVEVQVEDQIEVQVQDQVEVQVRSEQIQRASS